MTFARSLLLSAVFGSLALVQAQIFPSSCYVDTKLSTAITFKQHPLALGPDGDVVIGGRALVFHLAFCDRHTYGKDNAYEEVKGYLVTADDTNMCLSVSNLDQENATFSLQDCRFNGEGDVWASEAFAWYYNTKDGMPAKGVFNGENWNYVNQTGHGIYRLHAEKSKPDKQGWGKLLVDFTPQMSGPSPYLSIPVVGSHIYK
ncbi:Ricin B lectin domain protein [Kalmanozyma brasiliensis GHG001]|uniref:Uncharacterized protein n=1 Tax=Kalmanozyma brasiliensis (strain GHG001) TaxID=1365824 RepID=V5EU68_KALBG|nr:Ricin B lectin domain protein [Kalmanozyma brasiliensis GHG001]EST08905.1 Ricin B lectin domain protein [Kalmanozyma brasiliensis GHG001]